MLRPQINLAVIYPRTRHPGKALRPLLSEEVQLAVRHVAGQLREAHRALLGGGKGSLTRNLFLIIFILFIFILITDFGSDLMRSFFSHFLSAPLIVTETCFHA